MLKITFEPYEELTVEDLDRIMEFISQFGREVEIKEEKQLYKSKYFSTRFEMVDFLNNEYIEPDQIINILCPSDKGGFVLVYRVYE